MSQNLNGFLKTKQILTRLRVQKIVRSLNAVRNQYDKASKKSHSWPYLVLTNVVDWNDILIFSSRSTGRRNTTKLKSVCRRRWWLTGQTLQRLGNLHFYKMMGMTQSETGFFLSNQKKGLFIKPNLESSIYMDYVKLLQIGKKKEVN